MSSYVRILHASPDAPPVDVYANDNMIARSLTYRSFTEYLPVAPGRYNIKAYPAGTKTTPFMDTSLALPDQAILTAAVAGRLADIGLLPVSDQPVTVTPGKVNLKFVHLSPNAPNVDLTLPDGTILFKSISYKENTEYRAMNPGTYTLQARVAGTNHVVLTVPNQNFNGGKAYTAYAVGLAGGNPPLQLLTPLDGSSYLSVNDGKPGQTNNQGTTMSMVLDAKKGDVNGDGVVDRVVLKGNKPGGPESPFEDNISVCVENGKTRETVCTNPQYNAGYHAGLFLADFDKDHIPDILVRIESGGSGGYLYSYVYTFKNNQLVKVFDFEDFNEASQYEANFRDHYQVVVTSKNSGRTFLIDLRDRKEDYSDLYNSNGQLKKPVQGGVLALGALKPEDVDGDGDFELIAYQRIIGRNNADTLGYIKTTLEWDGSNFVPVDIRVV